MSNRQRHVTREQEMDSLGEPGHHATGADGLAVGTLCAVVVGVEVEPDELARSHRLVHAKTKPCDIALADPDPEAGHEAAEGERPTGEGEELERGDGHVVEEGVLCSLRRVGAGGEAAEDIKDLADDEGHEGSHGASGEGGEDGGDEEEEEVATGA